MQTMFNGRERSLSTQVELCRQAGWRVESVSQNPVCRLGYIIARPL